MNETIATTETPKAPKSPKARLIELITQPEDTRLVEFARVTGDGPHALIRTALMLAGFRVPEESELRAAFVNSLLHAGFYVVPAFLGVPELGDLFVALDGEGEPAELGFVAKFSQADLGAHGRLTRKPEWVMALPARVPDGRPLVRRVLRGEQPITFWLRLSGG